MPSSSSDHSADSGRSFFDHPRQAPLPPTPASRSARSTPEGFVLPVVPPVNDPLVVTRDAHGHRRLPNVSDSPLSVDDGRVLKLVQHHPMVIPKCANCAEMAVECTFTEAGIPCPPCSVLGIPDCDWADPFWFIENLQRCRDLYLLDERNELVKSVKDNRLAPSLFEREFERVQSWFYSGAQGAMSRFLINSHATRNIAVQGYQSLASASTDPTLLLRFLSLGAETQVHPLVLQVVAERVQSLFFSSSTFMNLVPPRVSTIKVEIATLVSRWMGSCFNAFRFNVFFDLVSLRRHFVKHEIHHCGYVSLHPTVPVGSAIKGSVANLSTMVSPIPGSLSKANEEIVRKVFKTIRATKYEDPVDQAAFLVDSANTVLEFRPQVASFVLVPELGECVFTIRSMMHSNNAHLGTPFSDAFISIQDFAGEIIRKRQLFRERRRANADRVRAAEGAAARIERNAALEHAANIDKAAPSPNEDAVSIPSGSDGSGTDEPPPASMNPPPSPISVDPLTNNPPSSEGKSILLFVKHVFTLLIAVAERDPAHPPALALVTKSLPTGPRAGLRPGPAQTPRKRRRLEEGEIDHSQAAQHPYARPSRPMQYPAAGSAPLRPASSLSEAQLRGRLAAVQAEIRRLSSAQKEKVKHCYHCTAPDHLVALCPFRETID
ncbi:hypothetical protein DFH08DRAFT_823522 [Mycena albidolilacea]|uniref:Uncharacterized protein n=1 Tax=Mycena albidolilacea TaxID=1033008 RepID=A0AAD6Z6K2_9AGAR|nr:hypothetical protein DFH08DRAFT_823522 [Mycena albidolilacea]